jgi:asparagine synthase (glutamine-hydrolysing)
MIGKLDFALTKAVAESTDGLEEFGILFSSGLDSSLIAKICEDLGRETILYAVGMPGAHDLGFIRKAKGFFRSEVKARTIDPAELEEYVEKTIRVIDDYNPVQVGIGIPLYIACEVAKGDGMPVILAGQGADELFAGYHRYLGMPVKELEQELQKDLEELYPTIEKRDLAIAGANSIELRLPYLADEVVEIAREIPVDLKIKKGVRKYILREVAKRKGLPEIITKKEKKAVQYSSGVDKALKKLSKAKNKSLKEYLKEVYTRTR